MFVGMFQFLGHDIAAGQADLVLFLRGGRTGILGLQFSRSAALRALMPVAFVAVCPSTAVCVAHFPFRAADIAGIITVIVISMLCRLGNNLRHKDSLTDGTDFTDTAWVLSGGG